MKIGIVCPYAWDIPGGVSAHVNDLAVNLIRMGHDVSVLAPAESDDNLPSFVVSTGKPRAVKYNGSIARLSFGPVTARRVSNWIRQGSFDVLHIHEPLAPSLSVLACWAARGPIVATWHSSYERSRMLLTLNKLAITAMEKISARIAVSEAARTTLVEHVGGDAVVIPNGVDVSEFAQAQALPGWPGSGRALVFLGRVDEPRKGLKVLLAAMPEVIAVFPNIRLLVAGPGDIEEALADAPAGVAQHVVSLGLIDAKVKPDVLASGDVYIAPNTGGESFGIVLLEAMAAGTPVLASDLIAFQRVLDFGRAGVTFINEDSQDCARHIIDLLHDQNTLAKLKFDGMQRAHEFDWATVSKRIVTVYESVTTSGAKVQTDFVGQIFGKLGNLRIKRSVSDA